jgi:2-phosphosulfolactate phosphatase
MDSPTVVIDCFPESARHHTSAQAIVVVDVLRATTTAVTAVYLGRRCYPAPSLDVAVPLAARLQNPLLVGELGGNMPYGFDLTNSPAELERRDDVERPMILLSTSGTALLHEARHAGVLYAACLRNWTAQVRALVGRHAHVAVLGAGTRGEFREEDQICCAWIAAGLLEAGYSPQNEWTRSLTERWRGAPADALLRSKSADYLRATEQEVDLQFVLDHVDDLDAVFRMEGDELVRER